MNFISKGFAMRNISAPILPMPSEPRVRPTRPTPICWPRELKPSGPERVSLSLNISFDRIRGADIGHLDTRRMLERRQVEVWKDRRAVGFLEIPGQSDAKFLGHARLLFAGFAQLAHALGERLLQQPNVARVAAEVKTLLPIIEARLDIGHQPAKRLLVLGRCGPHRLDRIEEFRV